MEKAGDILRKMQRVKSSAASAPPASQGTGTKALTPVKKRLIETGTEIRQGLGKEEVSYLASQLVQVTLPHSDPGDVPYWSRTNGNLMLSIVRTKPDPSTGGLVGYPYGTVPRLLLYWITSEATRTKSRALTLGKSLSEFMRDVGLKASSRSGARSDAHRLRDQMNRLFGTAISFQYSEQIGLVRRENFGAVPIVDSAELFWEPRNPAQGTLWESQVELNEKFFNAITSSPVPLDMRALRALHHSSLALDLYAWATYKSFLLNRKGQTQFVTYESLLGQLGADYGGGKEERTANDTKNFKKKLLAALKQVQAVYPGFIYKQVRGGLMLYPGRPAISPSWVSKELPQC